MRTVINNALLIDGTGRDPQQNITLEIVDGLIGRIGKTEDFGSEPPSADEVIDANGQAAVPGLINAHEHLTWRRGTGGFSERAGRVADETLLAKGVGNCLISLIEGVTTVRDVGAKGITSLTLKKAVQADLIIGPRIYACGQVLVMTGGHASEGGRVVNGVDQVRQEARQLLFEGADLIKMMASGGFISFDRDLPTYPQFTIDEMKAAFDEAHDQGKRTTVHCHNPEGIRRAVEAGVECIEHAGLLDEPTAELLEKHDVGVVPTLNVLHSTIKYGAQFGRAQDEIDSCDGRLEQSWKAFRTAVDAGVRISAGVDALGNLFEELELLVEGGLSPMQALLAGTKTNAELLGAQDLVGTLEEGKAADLLLVEGNPAQDISELRKITTTMKGGRAYSRRDLENAIGPALYY